MEYLSDEYIEKVYENIAKKIKKERERQGLTVPQLELKTGIDRTSIYKMENNKRRFGFENLIKVCHALNIKLSDLYEIKTESDGIKANIKKQIDLLSKEECYKLHDFIQNLTAETERRKNVIKNMSKLKRIEDLLNNKYSKGEKV